MSLVRREAFQIAFYDVEPGGRATIPALCRYLEEATDRQTHSYGFALEQVHGQGHMWVLTRFALRFHELPRARQRITVDTWASDRSHGVRAYRDYRVWSDTGELLVEASTLWLLLDATTRRPVRLPAHMLAIRHPDRVGDGPVDAHALQAPANPGHETWFQVRWDDLDENRHANNIRYIEWALAAIPLETRRAMRPASFDIQFTAEAHLGDPISSACSQEEGACHHILSSNAAQLALARSTWR